MKKLNKHNPCLLPRILLGSVFWLSLLLPLFTTNTKANGLSRHQAGFAIDLNGTKKLSKQQLQDLRNISSKHGLGPALNPDADKPHFSANPTKFGYKSLNDAAQQNRTDFLKKIILLRVLQSENS